MELQSDDTLKLTPSKARTAMLFAAMVVWFLLGAYRYATVGGIVPLALTAVGLLGAAVYGLMLIPGSSYLQASPRGLTIATAYRKRTYAWSEIDAFHVDKLMSRQVIKYRLVPDAAGAVREDTLPDTYGMPVEQLAAQLNAFRRRYGGAERNKIGRG